MTKKMDVVFRYGRMEVGMKDNGRIIELTDMEEWCMLKVTYTKENGKMIRLMEKEHIHKTKVASTKVNGLMTNKMDLVLKNGVTGPGMKVFMKME